MTFPEPVEAVPADEYRRLLEHHIECETLLTGLADAARHVSSEFTGLLVDAARADALNRLEAARRPFDVKPRPVTADRKILYDTQGNRYVIEHAALWDPPPGGDDHPSVYFPDQHRPKGCTALYRVTRVNQGAADART